MIPPKAKEANAIMPAILRYFDVVNSSINTKAILDVERIKPKAN